MARMANVYKYRNFGDANINYTPFVLACKAFHSEKCAVPSTIDTCWRWTGTTSASWATVVRANSRMFRESTLRACPGPFGSVWRNSCIWTGRTRRTSAPRGPTAGPSTAKTSSRSFRRPGSTRSSKFTPLLPTYKTPGPGSPGAANQSGSSREKFPRKRAHRSISRRVPLRLSSCPAPSEWTRGCRRYAKSSRSRTPSPAASSRCGSKSATTRTISA